MSGSNNTTTKKFLSGITGSGKRSARKSPTRQQPEASPSTLPEVTTSSTKPKQTRKRKAKTCETCKHYYERKVGDQTLRTECRRWPSPVSVPHDYGCGEYAASTNKTQ